MSTGTAHILSPAGLWASLPYRPTDQVSSFLADAARYRDMFIGSRGFPRLPLEPLSLATPAAPDVPAPAPAPAQALTLTPLPIALVACVPGTALLAAAFARALNGPNLCSLALAATPLGLACAVPTSASAATAGAGQARAAHTAATQIGAAARDVYFLLCSTDVANDSSSAMNSSATGSATSSVQPTATAMHGPARLNFAMLGRIDPAAALLDRPSFHAFEEYLHLLIPLEALLPRHAPLFARLCPTTDSANSKPSDSDGNNSEDAETVLVAAAVLRAQGFSTVFSLLAFSPATDSAAAIAAACGHSNSNVAAADVRACLARAADRAALLRAHAAHLARSAAAHGAVYDPVRDTAAAVPPAPALTVAQTATAASATVAALQRFAAGNRVYGLHPWGVPRTVGSEAESAVNITNRTVSVAPSLLRDDCAHMAANVGTSSSLAARSCGSAALGSATEAARAVVTAWASAAGVSAAVTAMLTAPYSPPADSADSKIIATGGAGVGALWQLLLLDCDRLRDWLTARLSGASPDSAAEPAQHNKLGTETASVAVLVLFIRELQAANIDFDSALAKSTQTTARQSADVSAPAVEQSTGFAARSGAAAVWRDGSAAQPQSAFDGSDRRGASAAAGDLELAVLSPRTANANPVSSVTMAASPPTKTVESGAVRLSTGKLRHLWTHFTTRLRRPRVASTVAPRSVVQCGAALRVDQKQRGVELMPLISAGPEAAAADNREADAIGVDAATTDADADANESLRAAALTSPMFALYASLVGSLVWPLMRALPPTSTLPVADSVRDSVVSAAIIDAVPDVAAALDIFALAPADVTLTPESLSTHIATLKLDSDSDTDTGADAADTESLHERERRHRQRAQRQRGLDVLYAALQWLEPRGLWRLLHVAAAATASATAAAEWALAPQAARDRELVAAALVALNASPILGSDAGVGPPSSAVAVTLTSERCAACAQQQRDQRVSDCEYALGDDPIYGVFPAARTVVVCTHIRSSSADALVPLDSPAFAASTAAESPAPSAPTAVPSVTDIDLARVRLLCAQTTARRSVTALYVTLCLLTVTPCDLEEVARVASATAPSAGNPISPLSVEGSAPTDATTATFSLADAELSSGAISTASARRVNFLPGGKLLPTSESALLQLPSARRLVRSLHKFALLSSTNSR